MQAALDHSLPIKRREAGLHTLVLWGRLLARNGRVSAAAQPSREPQLLMCMVTASSLVTAVQRSSVQPLVNLPSPLVARRTT
jgi:hypothetical protein